MSTTHHHLIRVALADLLPTQMTVGLAEVAAKRGHWARLKRREREHTLAAHWFPAVLGPGGRYYIVDHHHLGLALHEESVEQAWVMPLDDFSALDKPAFWRLMEFHRWAHPYDEKGVRRDYGDIPSRIAKLRDDPYRSLAGFVRDAGGYAKDTVPYAEFVWADFFRTRIRAKALRQPGTPELPVDAIEQAVSLARSPAARCLPGWTGVNPATAEKELGISGAPAARA